jgi:phosphoribosylamine--glycine ligase
MAQVAQCIPIAVSDVTNLSQFAALENIDLTFVGPEAPLAAGIVNEFAIRGLTIVGPSAAAARLEASKGFAKDFMQRHSIPTASYRIASSVTEAIEILESSEFGDPNTPVVVKADGLAAGKGVIMAANKHVAIDAVKELRSGLTVAAERIVIEETLIGMEASLLLFADGENYVLMPAARDHKRICEGDVGPNTGGMGAITDDSILSEDQLARITREIVEPTLAGARAEGFPFQGVLFIGLMLTERGPQVLEYNVRFGDPETQAILVRLRTDLSEIFQAMANRKLGEVKVEWAPGSSACVVLASAGYPGKYESGQTIGGLGPETKGVEIFHAGTSLSESGDWLTAGGRVLGITATGPTLDEALARSYERIKTISWPGMQYRRDIGRFGTDS